MNAFDIPWDVLAVGGMSGVLLKELVARFLKRAVDASEGYIPLVQAVGELKAQVAELKGIHGRFTEHHHRIERLEVDVRGLLSWRETQAGEREAMGLRLARIEVLLGEMRDDVRERGAG